ncbi:MAG: YchF family ATPase [Desulfobacterota bacterium]|nr:YchF family ATPase [Thermodesulfobacteriota bacterium]
MKIGLLGLPRSGKTTVFNALTKAEAPTVHSGGKAEPNISVVKVLDERVDRLSEIYDPKKTVYATVEFVDFVGLAESAEKKDTVSSAAMGMIKTMDALALVLRNFEDDLLGAPAPVEDFRKVNDELTLSDLILVENRLERIENGYQRGQRTDALVREEKFLRKISEQLNQNRPIRDLEMSAEEEKLLRGFQFLTKKPIMVILNSDETGFGKNEALISEIEKTHRAIEFAGKFEMELSQLDEEEAALFMEDMGIQESAYRRVTSLAYEILGYISFFTVGSDEVRAWNVRQGDTALDAAAAIHSDLARGFIRAECFSYEACLQYGSEKAIRDKGLFRLEGRDYRVQDGDILNIRFNV